MRRHLRILAAGALVSLNLVMLAIGVRDDNDLVCFWAIVGLFGSGVALTYHIFKR